MDKHLNYMEVRWKNFKGYKDTGWVKLKPITILIGSNNSGKTNFLAPLLLMSQTINSKDALSPLILSGENYDGGNYQEIVKDYVTENEIYFGYRYHIHDSDGKLKELGSYPPGAFEVTFSVDQKGGEIKLNESRIFDIHSREFMALKLNASGKYKYSGIGNDSITDFEMGAITDNKPVNFLFSSNTILSEFEANPEEKSKKKNNDREKPAKKPSRFSKGFSQFLSAVSYNNSRTRRYLGDLSFIGPIRESPRRIYFLSNETYETVGVRGENFANLIKKLGENNDELNTWVKRFGFGDKVELKHHYSNCYSLRFLRDGSTNYTSIANAGFGASQILPLIVQALVSPKRSITIAEQPEIHLNPSIQSVLADLFVSMAARGQTIITETHSEHLLLRLRRLIAQNAIKSENVAIYFVETDGTASTIREIELQKNGHINPIDWPKDFFGESLKESIALASEQAKRNKK
jgi:predicted ATPase